MIEILGLGASCKDFRLFKLASLTNDYWYTKDWRREFESREGKLILNFRDENIDINNGNYKPDGKQLIGDYISSEEIWACTSCNACVEACPVSINPLSIILDMRRFLVMEQSAAPSELNNMMTNIENNGAPWPYNQMDRLNWNNE